MNFRQINPVIQARSLWDHRPFMFRLFFRLLPVQILLIAVSCLNSVIDGSVASGSIGPDAMAVLGLYGPLGKCIDALIAVLLGGSQILCGRFLGKNEVEETQKVFSLDIIVTLCISGLLAALCLVVPGMLAGILGAKNDMRNGLSAYLLGISAGIPAQMIGSQLSAFLQLERQEKRTYIGIGAMVSVNIALDVILVSVMKTGFLGLGIATAVSNIVFCLVQLSYFMTDKAVIRLRFRKTEAGYLPEILRIGIPGALVQGCLMVRSLVINMILLKYAAPWGLPAYSAVNAFGCLYCAVYLGMGSATRLLSSVYIGEEDRDGLYQIMKTALTWGLALVAFTAVVTFFLAAPFARMFFHPADGAYKPALQFFRMFPISVPFSAVFIVFVNYYQSAGKMHAVNFLSILDGAVSVSGFSILLAPSMGYMGVWIAQILGCVFVVMMIPLCAAIVNRRFSLKLKDLMMIPEEFGVQDNDRMEITVKDLPGALQTSLDISRFCLDHGMDKKRAYYAGLCLEEMAVNVIRHGFRPKRQESVIVRAVFIKDELLICIKDSCRPFNPRERAELFDPQDPLHNVGIRMASRLSKRMEYKFILGLNVLNIVL